jgi:hypothetical protein
VADHPSWAWGWPSNSLIFNLFFLKKKIMGAFWKKKKTKKKRKRKKVRMVELQQFRSLGDQVSRFKYWRLKCK